MIKDDLRQLAQQAVASRGVTKVPSGKRSLSEREMYLRTEATDHEVQEYSATIKVRPTRQSG